MSITNNHRKIANYLLSLVAGTFVFLLIACTKTELTNQSGIELFHVKDYGVPLQNADIDTLELEGPSFIKREDILYFDLSTNTFVLKKDRNELFKELLNNDGYFEAPLSEFILTINKKPVFLGYFMNTNMTFGIEWPYLIRDEDYFPQNTINISTGFNSSSIYYSDRLRSNPVILHLFLKEKVVKPGIIVILDSLLIFQGKDTSTISYYFNITNNDKTYLYIPDPLLMGNDIFSNYTYGIVMTAPGKLYFPGYISHHIQRLEEYELSWYRKMKPGEKIYRSATVKGYEPIDPGTYTCFFCFTGPVSINNKIQPDGSRYWFGWTDSNPIEVVVSE